MYKQVELGDILQFQRGFDLPESKRVDGLVPIYSSSGLSGWHNKGKCKGPNVITGRYGTIGEVFFYDGECWPLNTALFVKDFKGNNPQYVYYLLKHVLKIDGKDKSTVPGVDRNVLHMMKVPFCSNVTLQKKVIQPLLLVDRLIETNNRIKNTLCQSILTIFSRWFNQFDYLPSSGFSGRTHGVFNERLKREIPSGWEVHSIYSNPLCSFIDVGIPYFEIKNYLATANVVGTEITDGEDVTYENRESRANMCPTINSVWFAKMKNSIKHVFISTKGQWMVDKYILSTGFTGLQCSELSFPYVASVVMQPYFEATKDILSHGATQQSVNNDDLDSIPLLIPPADVLAAYKTAVGPMFEKMNEITQENQCLIQLRNDLLPLLMNGQLDANKI